MFVLSRRRLRDLCESQSQSKANQSERELPMDVEDSFLLASFILVGHLIVVVGGGDDDLLLLVDRSALL